MLLGEAIREAGGDSFEFTTIGVDDGTVGGSYFRMRYSFGHHAIRSQMLLKQSSMPTGLMVFYIPNCDKITPGMILAAMRGTNASRICSGGPMIRRCWTWQGIRRHSSLFEAVGTYRWWWAWMSWFLGKKCLPNLWFCSGMFTANSMNCLMEVLGPAPSRKWYHPSCFRWTLGPPAKRAKQLVENIKKHPGPRDIVTKEAIDDACARYGFSWVVQPTLCHTLAIARVAGIDYDLKDINEIAKKTPYLSKIALLRLHDAWCVAGGVQPLSISWSKRCH